MLHPQERTLFMDSLRPPRGFNLDWAIGSTYSLDLEALLSAPLAFTYFDWEDQEGRPTSDPVALLKSLREYAPRISVFHQAGQVCAPAKGNSLFAFLEGCLHPVLMDKGSFHPKLWALRFVQPDGGEVRYRVLCLSRNLTFDRCWDTGVILEGKLLSERKKAIAANHPLGRFFEGLASLGQRSLSDVVRKRLERAADELRRVDFELPDGFEDLKFWSQFPEEPIKPTEFAGERLLVMSPFLSESTLSDLAREGEQHVLISRVDELQKVAPKTLKRFSAVYSLSPSACAMDAGEEREGAGAPDLRGLHAKLYIVHDGWNARVLTGSANATKAAFSDNVEFLVELVGKKSKVGIDALLGEDEAKEGSLFAMLEKFTPGVAAEKGDPIEEELDEALEATRRAVARALFAATVVGGSADTSACNIELKLLSRLSLPQGVRVAVRPISLLEPRALVLPDREGGLVTFAGVAVESATAFFAFQAEAQRQGRSRTIQFVLDLPLEGLPSDRKERILRSIVSDKSSFARLISLILDEEDPAAGGLPASTSERAGATRGDGAFASGQQVFELLLRTLAEAPERLDEVASVVGDLGGAEKAARVLPEGFDKVWKPILAAREKLRS